MQGTRVTGTQCQPPVLTIVMMMFPDHTYDYNAKETKPAISLPNLMLAKVSLLYGIFAARDRVLVGSRRNVPTQQN